MILEINDEDAFIDRIATAVARKLNMKPGKDLANVETMTVEEACLRHAGMKHSSLRKMCIQNQIKAQKVGKCWHVPVQELDRIFSGITKGAVK